MGKVNMTFNRRQKDPGQGVGDALGGLQPQLDAIQDRFGHMQSQLNSIACHQRGAPPGAHSVSWHVSWPEPDSSWDANVWDPHLHIDSPLVEKYLPGSKPVI